MTIASRVINLLVRDNNDAGKVSPTIGLVYDHDPQHARPFEDPEREKGKKLLYREKHQQDSVLFNC